MYAAISRTHPLANIFAISSPKRRPFLSTKYGPIIVADKVPFAQYKRADPVAITQPINLSI
jgi:hypothetical protein